MGNAKLAPLAALILAGLLMAAQAAQPDPEARAAAYFDLVAAKPPLLRIFLQAMPKGGDLHSHLSGAIYAEDFLAWASAGGLCIASDSNRIVAPPCDSPEKIPAAGLAVRDSARYSRVIDSLSVRGVEKGVGDPMIPGFDRFFSTFRAFGPAMRGNTGKAIAAAREAAALDHVSYLELMNMPLAAQELYDAAGAAGGDSHDFAHLSEVFAPLIPEAVAHARAEMDAYEAEADKLQDCKGQAPAPGCTVPIRYQAYAGRTQPPAQVFAALTFGFALAKADPRFVGVNIVAPEHDPVSVRDYALHMRMFAWLKARNPAVKLSLHAGELTLGLVPPRDLRFHIHDAVVVAGANRIGHGVDIPYEADAAALLRRMAKDRVAVEINLTSNAVILGVKGRDHPLSAYRVAGVPVVLATDDEGVSRSDMTNEYMRAAQEQGLRYRDLKEIARNSLEYAFLAGPSLWTGGKYDRPVPACAHVDWTVGLPVNCERYLAGSERARAQAELERQFVHFEAAPPEL